MEYSVEAVQNYIDVRNYLISFVIGYFWKLQGVLGVCYPETQCDTGQEPLTSL
jgi:hypothetical protein